MSIEETRALASLHNLAGYHLLTRRVVELREAALAKLKTAHGQEDIVSTAMEFRIWDEVVKLLERAPREAVEELKEQGDSIYG